MIINEKFLAYGAAIANVIIVGFSFMFVKISLQFINTSDILAYRFSIAILFIFIFYLFGWIHPKIHLGNVIKILPLAILYPLFFFFFQALGLVYLSSVEAGIFQATTPIFTMILASLFIREKTTFVQKGGILISVLGIVYIFIMKGVSIGELNWIGIFFILISAFSNGFYNVLARKMTKDYSAMDLTILMTIIGFIAFNISAIGEHIINGTMGQFFSPLKNPLLFFSILFLGCLSSLGTSFLTNFALSKIEATKVGIFGNLSTLITLFAGVIFLKEKLFYYHYIGAILVIFGVISVNILSAHKKYNKHSSGRTNNNNHLNDF